MTRRLTGLILLALAAVSAPAQVKDAMIYPRDAAAASAPATGASDRPGSLLLLGAAAAAAAGGWWLWQKRRQSAAGTGGSRLAVVETRPLGSRQYLVVADYDGRKFLLGVCPGSIELLTPLDGGGNPPAR